MKPGTKELGTVFNDDAYNPETYHPDDIANGNAAEAQTEDARHKAEDDKEELGA